MDTTARFSTPTTPLGARIYAAPDASARLAAVGLHHSDPRYTFALAGVRAAAPEKRAAVAERFRNPLPFPAPLPAIPLFDTVAIIIPAPLQAAVGELRLLICEPAMTWAARAETLRLWLCLRQDYGICADNTRVTRSIIAALFEGLGLSSIECVEHAAYMAVMQHASWREAAHAFLGPIAETWLQDWLADQSEFREIAAYARLDHPDVPIYLT